MKTTLLAALLLFTVLLHAQDTIKTISDTTNKRHWRSDVSWKTRFDIGLGAQLNSFAYLSTSAGPMMTIRANSKYGRIAGMLNVSYNFNNSYDYYEPVYWDIGEYKSHVRYNFLKISLAMQVPFFNRTNKKGFSMSALIGVSYLNGLGSGEFKSVFDENPVPYPPMGSVATQKFSTKNYNLAGFSVDMGFTFAYTFPFSHYQVFADAVYFPVVNFSSGNTDTIDKNYNNPASANNINRYQDYCINIGVRFCLYQPWQAKPPKRFGKK